MALKRKRSAPAFSSPASDTSNDSITAFSPLPVFFNQSKPIGPLHQTPTWSFPTYESSEDGYRPSCYLNSRTRKRHRDSRPDEESIHATTISRLYEAQRQHPNAEPVPSQPITNATTMKVDAPSQKSTLHSFWNIKTAQPRAILPMAIDSGVGSTNDTHLRCEDCDMPLKEIDAMDLDDAMVEQEVTCRSCGRHVCDRCAFMGNERVCLSCASR